MTATEWEVELLRHVEASTAEQAVLVAASDLDGGGSYRFGYRVRNMTTGEERFIDAETIDESLEDSP